jgi:hypothetical protein
LLKALPERVVPLVVGISVHVQFLIVHTEQPDLVLLLHPHHTVSTDLVPGRRVARQELGMVLIRAQSAAAGAPLTLIDTKFVLGNPTAVTTIAGAVLDPRSSEEAALSAETGSRLLAGLDRVVVVVEGGTRLVTAVAAMLVGLGVAVSILFDFDIVVCGSSTVALSLGLVLGL